MNRIFRLTVCLVLLCCMAAPAQCAEVSAVLKKVQEVYAGMKDFHAHTAAGTAHGHGAGDLELPAR